MFMSKCNISILTITSGEVYSVQNTLEILFFFSNIDTSHFWHILYTFKVFWLNPYIIISQARAIHSCGFETKYKTLHLSLNLLCTPKFGIVSQNVVIINNKIILK